MKHRFCKGLFGGPGGYPYICQSKLPERLGGRAANGYQPLMLL